MLGKQLSIGTVACFVLTLSPVVPAMADEPLEDGTERCVDIRRISRTDVVDDQTILFYMRGGKIYRNDLPHRCPGLRFEERFMYRITGSRLCDVDIITILTDHGFGFTPGGSCGLGKFYPISEDEAQALKERPDDIEAEEVPPPEPE